MHAKSTLADDLVDNGEFDDKERAWRLSSGKVEFVEEEKYEATNRFARIPQTDALFQDVALVPGHAYILEFQHRGLAGGTVSIKRSGENDPTHYEKPIQQTTGTTWHRFLDTFAVGNDWSPRLMIHFRAGPIPGQHVDIDKVTLYDQTSGERHHLHHGGRSAHAQAGRTRTEVRSVALVGTVNGHPLLGGRTRSFAIGEQRAYILDQAAAVSAPSDYYTEGLTIVLPRHVEPGEYEIIKGSPYAVSHTWDLFGHTFATTLGEGGHMSVRLGENNLLSVEFSFSAEVKFQQGHAVFIDVAGALLDIADGAPATRRA